MSLSASPPEQSSQAAPPAAGGATDDDEFDHYEAEAALLALHREQLRQQLLDDGMAASGTGGGAMDYCDNDMYEEQEEEVEELMEDGSMALGPSSSSSIPLPAVGSTRGGKEGATPKARSSTTTKPTPTGTTTGKPAPKQQRAGSAAKARQTSGATVTASGSQSPRGTSKLVANASRSTSGAPKPRRKRKERKKVINLSLTKYALIRELADEFGFVVEDDEEVEKFGFNMIWADTVMPLAKLARLANWQRFNHYPSMHLLCRKGHLGLTLGRMRRAFPDEYSFYPRTWSLRSERSQFAKFLQQQGSTRKTYIMKPNAGCQGKGIILTRDPLGAVDDGENYVVQEYMSKPLLIEGKKFDLRVYVLVTSVRHLSIMVFHEGLVRICAEAYQKPTDSNLANTCVHLTNYAVNKHSTEFVFNNDAENASVGNKRDFAFLNEWLVSQGHDKDAFWGRVDEAIVKTVIAALPKLQHVYSSVFPHSNDGYTCFEVLGFDVLIDDRLRPWILEVNHTPSFHTDTPFDHRVKHSLLHEVWSIVRVSANDKARHLAREKAIRARRLGAPLSTPVTEGPASASGELPLPAGSAAVASPSASASSQPPLPSNEDGSVDPVAVRALEDSRRKNFRRAFPHSDAMVQGRYDLLIRGSCEANEDKTTASQQARNNEVRLERDKREARLEQERQMMPGAAAGAAPLTAAQPAVSSSTSAETAGSPGAVPPLASGSRYWQTQLRDANASDTTRGRRATRRSSDGDGAGPDEQLDGSGSHHHLHHSMSAPPLRSKARDGGGVAATAPSTPPSAATSGGPRPRPAPPLQRRGGSEGATATAGGPDARAMRERLHEQMEKHRRRMILGPRLSVFQLRDTQLEAMIVHSGSNNAPSGAAAAPVETAAAGGYAPPPGPLGGAGAAPLPPSPNMASGSARDPTAPEPAAAAPMRRDKAVPPLAEGQRTGAAAASSSSSSSPAQQPTPARAGGSSARQQPPSGRTPPGQQPNAPPAELHTVAVSAATLQSHWLYHYDT